MYGIIIADCDRLKIKASVNSKIEAAKFVGNFFEPIIRSKAEPDITSPAIANVQKYRCEKRRRVVSFRALARNADDVQLLPSSKLQRSCKGVVNHLEYQELIKRRRRPLLRGFMLHNNLQAKRVPTPFP